MTNIIENNKARIRKAKIEHQAKLGREDRAQHQTDQVSHKHHSIHLNPSYKQFTYILADSKKKELSQQRSSVCLYTGSLMISETTSLFKDTCYLCKKGSVQYENKKPLPATIETDEAVETFLVAP